MRRVRNMSIKWKVMIPIAILAFLLIIICVQSNIATNMIIGCILMVSTIFLPLASAVGDRKEYLEEYADLDYMKDVNMTYEDAINMSVFEFGKLYYYYAIDYGSWDSAYTIWMALDVAFATFVILITLLAFTKKPIAQLFLV